MSVVDLLIHGGLVVDGSGTPPREANVAVKDGHIVYIGPDKPEATRSIDATGKIVAPGFVDTHTHYDAQITWDPWLRPHSQHGVTTFINGNCGFTLAPVSEQSLEYLVPMLARVEGIPLESLQKGAKINWRTTEEMLQALDGQVGINVGFMTGHSTLRALVMGDRALQHEATPEDVDTMKAQLRRSLEQGSLGFSSSHMETHMDHHAVPVPSRHSSRSELLELMSVVKEYEGTIAGYVLTGRSPTEDDMKFMAEVSLASGRAYAWPTLNPGLQSDDVAVSKLAATDVARAMGAELRVQAPSCPAEYYINLRSGHGWDQFPGIWNDTYKGDHAFRVARFADQSLRATFEADALKLPEDSNSRYKSKWPTLKIVSVQSPRNEPYVDRLVSDIAAEQGKTPFNALMDILVEDDLNTVLLQTEKSADELSIWKEVVNYMRDNRSLWGGDDGGAHLDALEMYSHSTRFIAKAVRDYRLIPIEEAIRHFTQVPARFIGLKDRGTIAEGMRADLLVFDLDALGTTRVELRADFPAGGERLYTGSTGFEYVLVNGTPIIDNGEYTDARPGKVLRAREDTYTVDISEGADITERGVAAVAA